jgi:glycosyltransferase involved in cell wall biosynthesis
MGDERIPVLYLAPWVDYGGTDKGTIDWFRWLNRERFRPSLITTQPSNNARLGEVLPYADEVWPLPELMPGDRFARFVCDFVFTRRIRVVHVMNSRLGFDLLPFLATLPSRPAVVVQLHVEEHDRSGYVRYVSTRYGNLVDAFSVTSEHLARGLQDYEVPRSKCRVIRTGVDATAEFNPDRAEPVEGLERDVLHLLFAGRLVPQKDPLLMVEVAERLRERIGGRFRVHVVGDGDLEPEVRGAVAERGLQAQVLFHGQSAEIARWYAACHLVLMTSVFEGVPYVLYEAMAMQVPAVVPALPGNVELLSEGGGLLVSPREDADAYASEIARLADDAEEREALGARGRRVALERHSLEEMASAHAELYEELLERAPAPADPAEQPVERDASPITCGGRPATGQPLVSVIVPCFNHGRYLEDCLESIARQTYPAIETIVVDDASYDPETVALIGRLGKDADVQVVRLPVNSGPSAARNAGVARARGRYILPVDADNLLPPDSVERRVEHLQAAGEQVGFIYPSHEYFGNRSDFFQAPEFNLYALLQGNFCDTSSLIDRRVFDSGVRYAEDLLLEHEDWDFALQLAERGVRGEPTQAKTLLTRKVGFTRSELIEHRPELPRDQMIRRHPLLYARQGEIKARCSPALSLLVLQPAPEDRATQDLLVARLWQQSCRDAELVLHSSDPAAGGRGDVPVRLVPAALADGPAARLANAVAVARGRYRLATRGSGLDLLADPALVEKVLRTFGANPSLDAIALHDAGPGARHPFELTRSADGQELEPHALAWRAIAEKDLPGETKLPGEAPLGRLAELLGAGGLQWRHWPAPRTAPHEWRREATLRTGPPARPSEAVEREERMTAEPLLPTMPPGPATWPLMQSWRPPGSRPLCRHRRTDGRDWIVTNERVPPPGYELDYDLGSINDYPYAGTLPLLATEGGYELGEGGEADGNRACLGYLEQAAFPLLDSLAVGIERTTGRPVLVSGEADPLRYSIDGERGIGWIEAFPAQPRVPPHAELGFGLVPLMQAIDLQARRHRYGLGALPAGELVMELGALRATPPEEAVPVWLTDDGRLRTDSYTPLATRPGAGRSLRWTLAPATWRGFSTGGAKARAVAGRALRLPRHVVRTERAAPLPAGEPAGYLSRTPHAHSAPLYSALHPVTGDQLLTRDPWEATDMGYSQPVLLGELVAVAPLTGSLDPVRVGVPWASRFGLGRYVT